MYLETQRLILRKLEEADYERLFLLDSNPEVMKYIGIPTLSKVEESKEVVKMIMQQYQDNGVGRLAVIEKESGLLIGWSGLKLNTSEVNGYQNFYELGYRFLPETWGKGYATESGKASLEYGFNDLKAEIIYAYAHCENQASNHILTKLGFEKTGEFTEPDGICFWYELKKENFK
ncbi:GNAT family N-acetyltransferase [Chryseobacterium sp. Ch-15]|uniref:GNAT family N-acetyltransferase n=1 Tax=Chryseobacterium muglaense TaxID=2893752 RepID=A0A9Q3YVA5_9FLAO|nr:GNAT family N-acetyltransferase [Chryseobacterium muglaense]MBD3906700.1 GNAT family N-acetyltransferase [Chryseobacterium muglaense]MCC9036652.1 GNAT family N-acetyltransferase [Chryseobacterium muglaense]MCM2556395.1 GNAT family N-acetyltransferase [Chryseobacterium muglaense]